MTAFALRTRRMVLKDMGKAGTAIFVFGLAACSSEPTSNATPTDDPDPSTTTREPTTTASSGATSSTSLNTGHSWHRANLGFVSAYILYRDGEAALVDTGVPDSEEAIEAALNEVGLSWDSVGHVIVTHHHGDHQGSLPAALEATNAPWYAGAGDMGAINAAEGIAVGDGESIFDLQIIETPGHTAGHLSVLDPISGVLVSGDALNGSGGGVVGANPQFSTDMDMANASVRKLATFDFEVALFGHGEPILTGARDAISALADTL